MSQHSTSVLVERRDALALVTLNRPERRNGVTVDMCRALYSALTDIAASDARVVVLRGAGQDFCVGADVGGGDDSQSSPHAETFETLGPIHHAATLLHTMPQVTIAAIDGGCAGAGMGYAMACDLRFATPEARFSTAFLNVAVSGDMGLIWSLARIVGDSKARDLLFLPRKITGDEALSLGLVTRLFERDELHDAALDLAGSLIDRDSLALAMMKANCLSAEQLDMAAYVDIETARHLHCTGRPDFARRMQEGFAKNRAREAAKTAEKAKPA